MNNPKTIPQLDTKTTPVTSDDYLVIHRTAEDEAEKIPATEFATQEDLQEAFEKSETDITGEAITSTDPGTPTSYTKYEVSTAGTYTNFQDNTPAAIVVSSGDIDGGQVYLIFDPAVGYWKKKIVPINLSAYILKAAISISVSKNLLDISLPGSAGYLNSGGAYSALAGAKTTEYIAVSATTQYTISGLKKSSLGKYIAYYDASNALISAATLASNGSGAAPPFTFTTPALCAYIRFTLYYGPSYSDDGIDGTAQLELGGAATTFEPYTVAITGIDGVGIKNADKEVYSKSESDALVQLSGYSLISKNLANPANIINAYVASGSGAVTSEANWRTISVVVSPSTTYTISGWGMVAPTLRLENAAGALISYVSVVGSGNDYTFTTPVGCVKIYFTIRRNTEPDSVYATLQVEVGVTATAYTPYADPQPIIDKINNQELAASFIKDTALTESGKAIATTDMVGSSQKSLTIKNSGKILFFGCSYTESYYAIRNKSWVNKLANFLEWTCFNMGESGNRVIDELNRFRNNTAKYGVSPQSLNGSLVWIGNIGNETLFSYYDSDLYIKQFRSFVEFAKYNGAQVVLSTDHSAILRPYIEAAIRDIAREYDCYFIPSAVVGDRIARVGWGGFWNGGHPGTRSNAHQFLTQLFYFNKIQRPKQSVKIFRKRSAFTPSTVADLNFEQIGERNRKWIELNSGEVCLKESDNSYEDMDNLAAGSYTGETMANEYGRLLNGNTVSFTDYALIDAILPVIRPSKITIKLKMANVGTFYLKNGKSNTTWETASRYNIAIQVSEAVYNSVVISNGDTYTTPSITTAPTLTYTGKFYDYRIGYCLCFSHSAAAVVGNDAGGTLTRTSGSGDATITYTKLDNTLRYHASFFQQLNQPEGAFEAVSATHDGTYQTIVLAGSDLQKYIQYDKLHLLIYDGSGYTISGAEINIAGGEEKYEVPRRFDYMPSGTELLSNTTIDATATGWTLSGGAAVDTIPSGYEDYPAISGGSSAKHVNLSYGAGNVPDAMKASVTIAASNGYRKLIVKVANRLFPKVYTPGGSDTAYTTTTREITPDSYEFGTIMLQVIPASGVPITLRQPTDIGWNLAVFEIMVPPFTGNIGIKIMRDPADIVDVVSYKNHTHPLQVAYISAQIVD